ncbi:hypothetical protein HO173_009363 [Letharia columbiana]|uniref:Uncharacterized protein n=1 Tax=Letharia columbiana TaxID=112416 RepID=A0A8H6FPT3_9LECA|nr:uncharacterized protein HO173_009363 [Letharia columbiana]KAF6232483.1 hypothetical protein HO173_009363 [Letharia columbiana]
MFGCDSAVHMAEEIKNAEVVVPVSTLTTTVPNGALGFAIVIAVLFLTTDITAALASPTGVLDYPFMQIFYDATDGHYDHHGRGWDDRVRGHGIPLGLGFCARSRSSGVAICEQGPI